MKTTNPTTEKSRPARGDPEIAPSPAGTESKSWARPQLIGMAVIVGLVVVIAALALTSSSPTSQIADMGGQGAEGPPLARDAATLTRESDGVDFTVDVPTPAPGSYLYATSDMVPPGATHPEVLVGDSNNPEVFTLWAFVFNYPELCTDAACDMDDVGDTPAKGGIFQVDGRIAAEDTLSFEGRVRLGQQPSVGSTLENPLGAEIHAGIAAHGKALTGGDLWIQLNSSIGNPTLWWAATFPAPSG